MTPMNIVFACDMGYAEHLAVAMCSLFENNQGQLLDVYVVHADVDRACWNRLERLAKRYGHKLIDVKILDQELDGLVITHYYTKGMYYRLYIAEKLDADKALYLDADIVVNGPISDLYNTDIDDCYLAGVINPGFDRNRELEMSEDSKYFNSGVMLLNLARFRRDDIKRKVMAFVERAPLALEFPDQSGLNSVVNGCWKEVHPKFNVQGCFFEANCKDYSSLFPEGHLTAAIHSPQIIHYSGSGKPWHTRYKHPYRRLYWKYLRRTPFSHAFPTDFTFRSILKWCLKKVHIGGGEVNH
jgi:lipopolysaccharide biosynthesis glycosyltransferase